MTTNTTTYQTKAQAIAAARAIRAKGKTAKIMRKSTVYTVPFHGLTTCVEYFIESN